VPIINLGMSFKMYKIAIYVYSSLFDNYLSDTDLYQSNKNNFVAIDEFQNGIILENLNEETIVAIINNQIGDREVCSDEELFIFEGGIYIEQNNHKIVSQCCGDIAGVEKWREIFNENNTYFKDIWIGHPWIFYKFDATKIYFSDYIEKHNTDGLEIKFEFNKTEFLEKLKQKIELFDKQKIKIFEVIDENDFQHKETLKQRLFDF
jgi:hypothetical protein